MLPDSVLSTTVVSGGFLEPRGIIKVPLVDWELGGNDLTDASDGLQVKVWKGVYEEGQVILSAAGVAPVAVLSVADIVEFSFTFDQNMRVAIAYVLLNGDAKFYWYDSLIADYTTTSLAAGVITPRCVLDDKRRLQSGASDIILAYIRSGSLYFRAQRDRYTVEYLLKAGVFAKLGQVGMNNKNRLQFELRG